MTMYHVEPRIAGEQQKQMHRNIATQIFTGAANLLGTLQPDDDITPAFFIGNSAEKVVSVTPMPFTDETKVAYMEAMRDRVEALGEDLHFAAIITTVYLHPAMKPDANGVMTPPSGEQKREALYLLIEAEDGTVSTTTGLIERHDGASPTVGEPNTEVLDPNHTITGAMVGLIRKNATRMVKGRMN